MSDDQTGQQPTYQQPAYQQPTYQQPTYQQPGQRPLRLTRSRDDRWLGGVCAGVAEYAGVDVTVLRILVVLGTIFGFGSLVLVYLVAWVLIPQD